MSLWLEDLLFLLSVESPPTSSSVGPSTEMGGKRSKPVTILDLSHSALSAETLETLEFVDLSGIFSLFLSSALLSLLTEKQIRLRMPNLSWVCLEVEREEEEDEEIARKLLSRIISHQTREQGEKEREIRGEHEREREREKAAAAFLKSSKKRELQITFMATCIPQCIRLKQKKLKIGNVSFSSPSPPPSEENSAYSSANSSGYSSPLSSAPSSPRASPKSTPLTPSHNGTAAPASTPPTGSTFSSFSSFWPSSFPSYSSAPSATAAAPLSTSPASTTSTSVPSSSPILASSAPPPSLSPLEASSTASSNSTSTSPVSAAKSPIGVVETISLGSLDSAQQFDSPSIKRSKKPPRLILTSSSLLHSSSFVETFFDFDLISFVSLLPSLPELRKISLLRQKLLSSGMKGLFEILHQNCPNICSLELRECTIGSEGMSSISDYLKLNSSLASLCLSGCLVGLDLPVGSDAAQLLATGLANNNSIYLLHISGNGIGTEGVKSLLPFLSKNTSLHMLYLSENDIGSSGAELLMSTLASHPTLRLLDLWKNQITGEAMSSLQKYLSQNNVIRSLNLGKNPLGDVGLSTLSDAIQKNSSLKLLNIFECKTHKEGHDRLIESLKMNLSLSFLYVDPDQSRDLQACMHLFHPDLVLKEMTDCHQIPKEVCNTVFVYLIGYGGTGKTSLKLALSSRNQLSTRFLSLLQTPMVGSTSHFTKLIDQDDIWVEGTWFTFRDFGGQHHYHHSWHLFLQSKRSIFVVFANPLEEGFQSQVHYFLRLISLKKEMSMCPCLITFSHLDQKHNHGNISRASLNAFFQGLRQQYAGKVNILDSELLWIDCRKICSREIGQIAAKLKEAGEIVRREIKKIYIPVGGEKDLKFIANYFETRALRLIYSRKEIEELIISNLGYSLALANFYIGILLGLGEWISFEDGQLICVNVQRFGREILHHLTFPLERKVSFSREEFVDFLHQLNPYSGNIDNVIGFLEYLQLCFSFYERREGQKKLTMSGKTEDVSQYLGKGLSATEKEVAEQELLDEEDCLRYFIPSIALYRHNDDDTEDVQTIRTNFWTVESVKDRPHLGRRFRVLDDVSERETSAQMFPPSFLPQLICSIFSNLLGKHCSRCHVWSEGVALIYLDCRVVLRMPHAQVKEYMDINRGTIKRSHGEAERLMYLDICIKSNSLRRCTMMMKILSGCVEYTRREFWPNLEIVPIPIHPLAVEKGVFDLTRESDVGMSVIQLKKMAKNHDPIWMDTPIHHLIPDALKTDPQKSSLRLIQSTSGKVRLSIDSKDKYGNLRGVFSNYPQWETFKCFWWQNGQIDVQSQNINSYEFDIYLTTMSQPVYISVITEENQPIGGGQKGKSAVCKLDFKNNQQPVLSDLSSSAANIPILPMENEPNQQGLFKPKLMPSLSKDTDISIKTTSVRLTRGNKSTNVSSTNISKSSNQNQQLSTVTHISLLEDVLSSLGQPRNLDEFVDHVFRLQVVEKKMLIGFHDSSIRNLKLSEFVAEEEGGRRRTKRKERRKMQDVMMKASTGMDCRTIYRCHAGILLSAAVNCLQDEPRRVDFIRKLYKYFRLANPDDSDAIDHKEPDDEAKNEENIKKAEDNSEDNSKELDKSIDSENSKEEKDLTDGSQKVEKEGSTDSIDPKGDEPTKEGDSQGIPMHSNQIPIDFVFRSPEVQISSYSPVMYSIQKLFNVGKHTSYYLVFHTQDELFICVRGSTYALDFVSDSMVWKHSIGGIGGYIHFGFVYYAKSVFKDLIDVYGRSRLEEMRNYTLYISGHSLGGAIAIILSHLIRRELRWLGEVHVTTIGAPLVGDECFRAMFGSSQEMIHNFVHPLDPVPFGLSETSAYCPIGNFYLLQEQAPMLVPIPFHLKRNEVSSFSWKMADLKAHTSSHYVRNFLYFLQSLGLKENLGSSFADVQLEEIMDIYTEFGLPTLTPWRS